MVIKGVSNGLNFYEGQSKSSAYTGCSLEDPPGTMDDRDRWRERVREICTSSTMMMMMMKQSGLPVDQCEKWLLIE